VRPPLGAYLPLHVQLAYALTAAIIHHVCFACGITAMSVTTTLFVKAVTLSCIIFNISICTSDNPHAHHKNQASEFQVCAEHKHYYLYLLVPMYQCRTLRQKLILPSELSDVHIH